jgi:hypothetical protein
VCGLTEGKLFGGFLLLVSLVKISHAAYAQSVICFGAGTILAGIGVSQFRIERDDA